MAASTKATFSLRHNIKHTQAFVPASSNRFHCRGVTTRQAEIRWPPFSNPQQKTEEIQRHGILFFIIFSTNYLMCDLRACLTVIGSLSFILSFNLSSNLFATAEPVSQQ